MAGKAGKTLLLVATCALVALVAALPATANSKPTTGTPLRLGNPPATFAAGAPFYDEHGYACDLGDSQCIREQISANGNFELYVDGALQPSTVDVNVDVQTRVISKLYLSNFPSGLPAGEHSFLEVWYLGGVVVQTRAATITFV